MIVIATAVAAVILDLVELTGVVATAVAAAILALAELTGGRRPGQGLAPEANPIDLAP